MFRRRNKKSPVREGRWTQDEHERFLQGMQLFGRSWSKVSDVVVTRNTVQVRSHAQKYEMKMEKAEKCAANKPTGRTSEQHQIDEPSASSNFQISAAESVASTPADNYHEIQDRAPVMQQIEREDVMMAAARPQSPNPENLAHAHDSWPALSQFDDFGDQGTLGNLVGVSEMMQFEPWNELPGTSMMAHGTRSPALTCSSEDEVMLYFDASNATDVGMSADLMAWDGVGDELDTRMFPSFPADTGF